MMNHLKSWAKKNQFYHLLTYADDFAIGYFQRQGFTLEIEIDKKDWDIGFLKYYDNATLMHCHIDNKIDYLEVSEQLRLQRMAFIKKMKQLSSQHLIYPGVKDFLNGAVQIDLEKLQGLKEAGWEPTKFKELMHPDKQKELYDINKKLIQAIKQDEDSWAFLSPVVEIFPADAEKYLQQVKDPIDLRTIEGKLEKGFYITHEMLLADLQRMVDNCMAFNPKESEFHELAEKINNRYLVKNKIEV
uniref:Bromo domain-containing protein n=1 Tax=Arcella intermedia TaxID=1963864 RepID=A0A6B2LF42_9EUKA